MRISDWSSDVCSSDLVYVKRDGFYDLIDTSGAKVGDTNDRHRSFLRGQALYEPNDALSIQLIGDYTHRDESCCGAAYIETRERVPAAGGGFGVNHSNRIIEIFGHTGAIFTDVTIASSLPLPQDTE